MQLIRLAFISFDKDFEKWEKFALNAGDVHLGTFPGFDSKKHKRLLVIASIKLECNPTIDNSGLLIVSANQRKLLETYIEMIANLISISEKTSRKISSPTPPVAFVFENKVEEEWLKGANGIYYQDPICISTESDLSLNLDEFANHLGDRIDGISLLAEAINNKHMTGRFREFIRLFERAFTKSSTKLIEPLYQFLSQNGLGYEKEEIKDWLITIRHPATHADEKEFFVTKPDVLPVIERVEQAAYDVLMNKSDWRSSSTSRRNIWRAPCGSKNRKGDHRYLTRGHAYSDSLLILDEFGVFPSALDGIISNLPVNWIHSKRPNMKFGGQMEVCEEYIGE